MNLKRGFRRVFIIATCLSVFACLVVLPYELRQVASDRFLSRDKICLSVYEKYPVTEKIRQDCFASAERDLHDEDEKYSYPRFYKENWKMLVVFVLGGPVLVYLAALTLVWMYRGFVPPSSALLRLPIQQTVPRRNISLANILALARALKIKPSESIDYLV